MARSGGSNTGRGNYPAARVSVSAEHFKASIKSIPKVNAPNRALTTNQYKKSLKKEPESDA